MSDLISRQAVIDEVKALQEAVWKNWREPTLSEHDVIRRIRELPSVQPEIEPKTGHWIDYYGEVEIYNAGGFTETRKIGVKCSVCQWINRWYAGNYCGNCGAKMEGDVGD